jgi:hypothetical protein
MNAEETQKHWATLPMKLMKYFNDAHEWCLMETIWFKSNLNGIILNLSDLNNSSPIKSRPTLLRVLSRLVQKGWITKTPLKENRKHNKYALNRDAFLKWVKEVSNETSERCQIEPATFQIEPVAVLNETGKGSKRNGTDNLDKALDNSKDNSVPVKPEPEMPEWYYEILEANKLRAVSAGSLGNRSIDYKARNFERLRNY